jgi:hypothetical protein
MSNDKYELLGTFLNFFKKVKKVNSFSIYTINNFNNLNKWYIENFEKLFNIRIFISNDVKDFSDIDYLIYLSQSTEEYAINNNIVLNATNKYVVKDKETYTGTSSVIELSPLVLNSILPIYEKN